MLQRSWIWSLVLAVAFALVALFIRGNALLTGVAALLAVVNLIRAAYVFIRDRRAQTVDGDHSAGPTAAPADGSTVETGRHPEG